MNTKILHKLQELLASSPQLIDDVNSLTQAISVTFGVDVELDDTDIVSLTNTIDDEVLRNYFSKVWQPKTKKYKYSGLAIVDEINNLKPQRVLDFGCGYNEFKGKIDNLVGVDAYNPKADINSSILEYETSDKYDAVICLGSINFGTVDKIYNELKKAVSLTNTGGLIFLRVNPGRQHDAPEAQWIDFFNWDSTFILNAANQLDCEISKLKEDGGNRLYLVLKVN